MLDSEHLISRSWFTVVAGLLGASAVALGAFHAHGMEKQLAAMGLDATTVAHRMELCGTGLRYQLTHAVALLAVSLVAGVRPSRLWKYAGRFMILGTLLFSGSLYAIVATGISKFGAVTPLGGLSLIIAWLIVATGGLR